MRKNKFLAALAIAACLATSVPFSVNAATPGQAKDASKVTYGTVSTANQAIIQKLFDATYYAKENPDLAKAGITTEAALFNHFVKFGIFEGRACCEGFNVAAYKSSYSDLQAAFGDDIVAYYVHYVTFGQTEKRALVTVEAAAAAGVTVKSAADGTVVAAGAAKPAAGGAAGSGSNQSSNSGSGSGATNSTAGSTVFVQNTAGIPTGYVEKGSTEVRFNTDIDYDYENGTFYNFSAPKVSTSYGINYGGDFVEVDGRYYQTASAWTSVHEDYVSVGWLKYINTAAPLVKKVADKENYIIHDVDPSVYAYVENVGWFKRATNNEQYYTVSGGQYTWNLNKDYAVWNNKNDEWNVVFRSTNGSKTVGIKYEATRYLRRDSKNNYYTTYHNSKASLNGTVSAKKMDNDMLVPTGVAVDLNKALLLSVQDQKNNNYFSVSARDGYVLGETKGNYKTNAAGVQELWAYEKASMKKACKLLDGYKELSDGSVVIWNNGVPAIKADADVSGYYYCKEGYYEWKNPDTNATNIYKICSLADALKANDYYLYKDGAEIKYQTTDGVNYWTASRGDWRCYGPKTEVDEGTAKGNFIPCAPSDKYIENKLDKTFYPIEKTEANIFRDATAVYRQNTADSRFYAVGQ